MRRIPRYKLCFVCGRDNAAGLDVEFFRDGPKVVCDWIPHEKHLGYRDRVHGGIVATILDEAMSWAPAAELGRMCYSIELSVKYRQPIPSGAAVRVEAEVVELRSRAARTRGRIVDSEGRVRAEATGLYFPLPGGKTEEILPCLYLEGDDRPVTLEDL
ncbi:MAG: PaaI family thioesterase [Planctomycetes bacterium]|nr:PaaI family thioesterase [Planctomycetota bacterium]